MLLTLTTTHRPATDLGHLLRKHPDRVHTARLAFGQAHVFYPVATEERCTAALLLDIDPVGLVRNRKGPAGEGRALEQYVNDRPYVASSFLSVALADVYSSALSGNSKDRPELVERPLPLEAGLSVLPCRGGETFLRRLFEPLGYSVTAIPHALDSTFADWGQSAYFTVTLTGTLPVRQLLAHLYVLVPVLDNDKHYWVGDDEVEKLLRHGAGWLASHPEKELITSRYLKRRRSLIDDALARLAEDAKDELDTSANVENENENENEAQVEVKVEAVSEPGPGGGPEFDPPAPTARPKTGDDLSLNAQRLGTVLAAIKASGASSVLDLGCGEGKLLQGLLREKQFERIVGMDVSHRALEIAQDRLKLDRLPEKQRQRVQLIHGSLMYRDRRLEGFDAAAVVEVVEHLDPPRLEAFERAVFECARPGTVVVTTPNAEYNVKWETLPAGTMRHKDHRFEWTRAEFQSWAASIGARFNYRVRFLGVGPEDARLGTPTQMGIFERVT